MASPHQCLASLAKLSLSSPTRPSLVSVPRLLAPAVSTSQVRFAGAGGLKKKDTKKKRKYKTFRSYNLGDAEQYSLCDAIRHLRAFEVGQPPMSVKYEIAVKLKTSKSGAVLRNRIKLPHPVKTDAKVAVICPEDSAVAAEARQLGAVAVGEESLFERIRGGDIPFTMLICHTGSEDKLKQANLGRILGPKGLMPNLKMKTITSNVKALMTDSAGAAEFRERRGVLRIAIGQLGFTPEMVAKNLKAVMGKVKNDIFALDENAVKSIDEVVLSSTNGPGFSLNGGFKPTEEGLLVEHLISPM